MWIIPVLTAWSTSWPKKKVHGLAVMGALGEGHNLTESERKQIITAFRRRLPQNSEKSAQPPVNPFQEILFFIRELVTLVVVSKYEISCRHAPVVAHVVKADL